jgi:hypothetical protein
MEEKANLDILQTALTRVFGNPVEVKLVMVEDAVEQPAVVRKAVEIFGKDRVKIIE